KEAGLPTRIETILANFALARQVLANEARVRPVGLQLDLAFTANRGHVELAGALQLQVERIFQALRRIRIKHRQRRMHASPEQVVGAARLEAQGLLIELEFEV